MLYQNYFSKLLLTFLFVTANGFYKIFVHLNFKLNYQMQNSSNLNQISVAKIWLVFCHILRRNVPDVLTRNFLFIWRFVLINFTKTTNCKQSTIIGLSCFAPTILQPWVWIISTLSKLLSNCIIEIGMTKKKINKYEALSTKIA